VVFFFRYTGELENMSNTGLALKYITGWAHVEFGRHRAWNSDGSALVGVSKPHSERKVSISSSQGRFS